MGTTVSNLGERFPVAAQEAFAAGERRLDRAVDEADVEGTIGAAKDLIETAAKVVLDRAGSAYGSHPSLQALAAQALNSLELHPSALHGRPALRQLSQSAISVADAAGELRRSDGTGHGRATPSELEWADALLVRDAAVAWCAWVLSTADRVLKDRAGLEAALADIGGKAFSRNTLATLLKTLDLPDLHRSDQRRLGLAVARRWTVNETFMPLLDVIEPVVAGEAEYPVSFYEGLIEGLFLDHDGYVRTSGRQVTQAVGIGLRLSGAQRDKLYVELADRIDEAQPSYAFDGTKSRLAIDALGEVLKESHSRATRKALTRIAERLRTIVPPVDPEPATDR